MQNQLNLDGAVESVSLRTNLFTPEGGSPIEWYQVVLEVTINGAPAQVPIKVSPDKALLLRSVAKSAK